MTASLVLGQAGCMSANTRRAIASAERSADVNARQPQAMDPSMAAPSEPVGSPVVPDDAALAGPVELPAIQAATLARNPGLAEARYRVRALTAQARGEASLPPPVLMSDLWQVPLERPYAVDQAGMLMISLRQEIPPVAALDRTAQATALEAQAAAAMSAARARILIREVDRAFADYTETTARAAARREHLALVARMATAARARYAAGAPLADITRAELEWARVEADIAREEGLIEEARAVLNGLMARPVDAPLGPPKIGDPRTVRLSRIELAARSAENNPEVSAARSRQEAARSMTEAADAADSVPTFMVGLNYFHPVGEMTGPGWGASFGLSLPWLWGPASDRTQASEQRALAERAAAETASLRVRTEAARALASLRAAERRFTTLRDVATPSARRALDALSAGYAAGGTDILMWLDAARSSLDVAIAMSMARGDLERALADLDWAAGERVARVPVAATLASSYSSGAKR